MTNNQGDGQPRDKKLPVLENSEFFEERAGRADYARFDRIMARKGGEAPREGTEQGESLSGGSTI